MNRATVRLLVLAAAAVLPSARADDRSVEDDIFEAVFHQQITELLDPGTRARGVVLCLAVDPGGAPQSVGKDLLARLKGEASVRRAAECEVTGAGPARSQPVVPRSWSPPARSTPWPRTKFG